MRVLANRYNFEEIRCNDAIAGSYGVRGKRDGSELVILQGANEEWYAFSYSIGGGASDVTALDTSNLDAVASKLEAALKE